MKRILATMIAAVMLLSGLMALAEDVAQEALPAATVNDVGQYRVYVIDAEGGPVEGAVIQFCDDTTCAFLPTDETGLAAFEPEIEKVYEVHVLQAPEGFQEDENIYNTLEVFSDVSIVLEKADDQDDQ